MYKVLLRLALAMWGTVLLMTGMHVLFSDQGEKILIRMYVVAIGAIIIGGYIIYKSLFNKVSYKKNILSKKEKNIQHGLILFFIFCLFVIIFLMFA